jgi:hypothetical protein
MAHLTRACVRVPPMLRSLVTSRISWALAGLMVLAVLLPVGVRPSEAAYVAQTANPDSVFSAAASFNTVSVALANPGSPLRGNVTLTATAASDRGIADVVFQTSPAGAGTWTTACTATTTPFTCTWDTTAVADGLRDVRAVATDDAGYTRTDTVTDRRVDNTAPTATTDDPGSPLTATVTVGGSASDGGSGLTAVTMQYRSSTGSWTDICTAATSPISCSWGTAALADGLYDLRTVATDAAGNSQASNPVYNRRVDSTAPTVTMTDPGTDLDGTVTLQSTSSDGAEGSGVASVRYEYKLSSGSTWATACSSSASPFSCSFATGSLADGVYDFRAIATDGVGKTGTSATVGSRRIDNTAPATAVLAPLPTPLQGTVAMAATAADAGAGIADVRFQYAPTGTTTWTDVCTDASAPYTCSFATTAVADGVYDLRVLATDNAGNTLASTTQTRTLDNNGPTVTLTGPAAGASVRGTINVDATATDVSGVASVAVQYRLVGAATWTTLCTDVVAPYSCALNTTTLTSGSSYEIRLAGTDTLLQTTTTTPITITVDNVAPTAVDIQALNGGTANTMDAGDTLTFTYSEPILPSSLLSGWDGTATAVTVRVTNAGANDTLEIYNAPNTTKVNLTAAPMALSRDVVSTNSTFSATMRRSGNAIVVTLGALTSGAVKNGVKKGAMTWTPSAAATDLAGNAASVAAVTETGAVDRDF